MPAAAFILVVMGLFALTLSRNTAQTKVSSLQEGISLQAFYAAESGAQYAMNQLFYNAADRATVDANCVTVNGSTSTFSVPGLNNCSSTLSCSLQPVAGVSYYAIESDGVCGTGSLSARRTIAVSALME